MSEHDKKREMIIDCAMKRFSHFGIQKTTMNEIAEDIAVSQPSLYYYFPDKTSLIIAVIEKIAGDYIKELAMMLQNSSGLKQVFLKIIQVRKEFVRKYFVLHLTDAAAATTIKENCDDILKAAGATELKLLTEEISAAAGRKEITVKDPEKIANIFLDTLTGLSMFVLSKAPNQLVLREGDLDLTAEKQQEVADLFLKGLRAPTTHPSNI